MTLVPPRNDHLGAASLQNPGIGSANVRPPFRACRAVNSAVSRRGATSPPSDEKRPRTGAEARWAFRLVLPKCFQTNGVFRFRWRIMPQGRVQTGRLPRLTDTDAA